MFFQFYIFIPITDFEVYKRVDFSFKDQTIVYKMSIVRYFNYIPIHKNLKNRK